jgi:hypothetical protein
MEILIKSLGVTPLNNSRTFMKYSYEIYSTHNISSQKIIQLISVFVNTAQNCDITEVEINRSTNLAYKLLYRCSVTIDSSD